MDLRKPVSLISRECEADENAVNNAIAGSLIVIIGENIDEVYQRLNYYLQLEKKERLQ